MDPTWCEFSQQVNSIVPVLSPLSLQTHHTWGCTARCWKRVRFLFCNETLVRNLETRPERSESKTFTVATLGKKCCERQKHAWTGNIFFTYQRECVGAHMHALRIVVVAVSSTRAEGERPWRPVSTTNHIRDECWAQMDVGLTCWNNVMVNLEGGNNTVKDDWNDQTWTASFYTLVPSQISAPASSVTDQCSLTYHFLSGF